MTGLFQGRNEATLVELLVCDKPVINSSFSFTDHSEATALQRLPGRALESVRGATSRHPAASGPLLTAEALSLTKRKPDSSVDEDIASLPPAPALQRALTPGFSLSVQRSCLPVADTARQRWVCLGFPSCPGPGGDQGGPWGGDTGGSEQRPCPSYWITLTPLPGSLHTRPLSAGPRTGLVPVLGLGLAG